MVANRFSDFSILIVDDEERLLTSLSDLLSREGYQVTTALGGKKALQLLKKNTFDLVLIDLIMPGVNGIEVMNFILGNKIDSKVIVVSGDASVESAISALRSGAYDFVRKPYEPEMLIKTIGNAARKRKLEIENREINEKLLESEKIHRYIVQSSPDIIYILDQHGQFTFVNDRAELLLGFKKQDMIGKHFSEVVCAEDTEVSNYTFNERRTGDRACRSVEMRLNYRSGEHNPRYFETNAMPVEITAVGMYSRNSEGGMGKFVGTYGVARDITDRKKAEEIINYQAYHDLLTGLPNRTLFSDRLSLAITQAKRSKQALAVMFLDLDRFKLVNDTLGHAIGDELLQAVSKRLKGCLREGDTLSRVGGDEFNLLLPAIPHESDAAKIASKIIHELKLPFVLEEHELFISASIGISVYPKDGITMESLIKHADIAMYHVKGAGKDSFNFYSGEMKANFSRHLTLESGMRKALEANQFVVFYQPQVDVRSRTIVGLEALIRWQHPVRGLLSPIEFIPFAEESGLILPIGEWLLCSVCKDLRRWRSEGLTDIRVGINLSVLQVEQDDFMDMIIEILNEYDIPGSCLEIEITENLVMKDVDMVVGKLRKLSSYGIRIAIDDFGTGYSSLSYLKKLPIHTLKIDRSFVMDVESSADDSSIVSAIISMAEGLKLNLVAEGVETITQMKHLDTMGCHKMQGYLFSRPLPAPAAGQLLSGNYIAGLLAGM